MLKKILCLMVVFMLAFSGVAMATEKGERSYDCNEGKDTPDTTPDVSVDTDRGDADPNCWWLYINHHKLEQDCKDRLNETHGLDL